MDEIYLQKSRMRRQLLLKWAKGLFEQIFAQLGAKTGLTPEFPGSQPVPTLQYNSQWNNNFSWTRKWKIYNVLSNTFSRGFFKNFKIVPKNKFWNTIFFWFSRRTERSLKVSLFFNYFSNLIFNFQKVPGYSFFP